MPDEATGRAERRSRRRRRVRRAIRGLIGLLVFSTTLPLIGLLGLVWTNGWSVHSVQSGSMEPNLPLGSAAVIAPVAPGDIEVGTILAFVDPEDRGRTVVHRVRRIIERQGIVSYETQGDANATPDRDLVPQRMVRGEVVRHVVGLGAMVDWVSNRRNAVLLLVVPTVLLLANEVVAARQRRRAAADALEIAALRARVAELEAELVSTRADRAVNDPVNQAISGKPIVIHGRRDARFPGPADRSLGWASWPPTPPYGSPSPEPLGRSGTPCSSGSPPARCSAPTSP